jgi:hypothetical protein
MDTEGALPSWYGVIQPTAPIPHEQTERRGRVVNIPASYSRGPGFEHRPGDRLTWCFSWFASFPPDECWDSTLKLGHDRFLPNPFQFTIQLSPFHSMPCSLSYWKRRRQINYKLNKFMKTYPWHPRLGLPMHVLCSFFHNQDPCAHKNASWKATRHELRRSWLAFSKNA